MTSACRRRYALAVFINPFDPDSLDRASRALAHYDEEVVSTDPFEARLTFTADGDRLTLTLDDDLSVVDVTVAEHADQ